MPDWIRLRRTKGWRKPPDAITVARPTRWGNPYAVVDRDFVVHLDGRDWCTTDAHRLAVELFRDDLYDVDQTVDCGVHCRDGVKDCTMAGIASECVWRHQDPAVPTEPPPKE